MKKLWLLIIQLFSFYLLAQVQQAYSSHNIEFWQFQATSRQTLEQFAYVNYAGTRVRFPVARYQNQNHVFWITSQPGSTKSHLSFIFDGFVTLKHPVEGVDVQTHYKGENRYQVDLFFTGTKKRTEREVTLQGSSEFQGPLVAKNQSVINLPLQSEPEPNAPKCSSWLRKTHELEHTIGYMGPERRSSHQQEQLDWLESPEPYTVMAFMMTRDSSDSDSTPSGDEAEATYTEANQEQITDNTDSDSSTSDSSIQDEDNEPQSQQLAVVPYNTAHSDSGTAPSAALLRLLPAIRSVNNYDHSHPHSEGTQLESPLDVQVMQITFMMGNIQLISETSIFTFNGQVILARQSHRLITNQEMTEEQAQELTLLLRERLNAEGKRGCRPSDDPSGNLPPDFDRDGNGWLGLPKRRSICESCTIL